MTETSRRPARETLPAGASLLFQGDSITDVNRQRKTLKPNRIDGLGQGYAHFVAARLLAERPADALAIYNRGVSGDKVPDLAARWEIDTLALEPDVLSILVGVNDLKFERAGTFAGSRESFEDGYHELLDDTRRVLPDVRLVLCEPFLVKTGMADAGWWPEIDARRRVVRELAETFGALFVPFQGLFDRLFEGRAFDAVQQALGARNVFVAHVCFGHERDVRLLIIGTEVRRKGIAPL